MESLSIERHNKQASNKNKQTILTSKQRHRNNITNGQHLNRHADRPYVFYFFSSAHFFKTILSQPTNGTFGFAPTCKAVPSHSQKSYFLPTPKYDDSK